MFNSGSDPFIKALKSVGYLTVRLPKADIAPLQVLMKNGNNLERLGSVTKLLTPGTAIPVPTPTTGTPTANINGQRTGEMKIGLGLSILGNIIGAMGGSNLGVDIQYQQAKSAVFEFQGVTEDKVEIIDLDQYLGDSDINPASVFVSQLLDADQLFITTAVLKSKEFTFQAKSSSGVGLKVDVPVIQAAVGGNLSVNTASTDDTKITYSGPIPLVFGFQAVRVFFDNGVFTAFKPAEDVVMKSITLNANQEVSLLMTDDTFARLK